MASATSLRRSIRTRFCAAAIGLLLTKGATADPPVPADKDPLGEDGSLKAHAYRLWKDSGSGFKNIEHAAWIVGNADPDVSLVEWPHRNFIRKEVWSGPRPAHLSGVLHTHPDSVDPRPSPNDVATARSLGIPNYVVSRQGIWKATPLGEIVRIEGEAWIVRCASPRGCGAGEPPRVVTARLDGRPPEGRDGLP